MKRIISCNDGTWNQPDTTDGGAGVMTNVEKIYKCICAKGPHDIEQVKFYDSGVGTGPGRWQKISGGVTGKGIDKNIKDTYKFLIWNYTGPEDELYFFGFSRGAYTARSLAGFIRNCGILKPQYLHLVDEAYELYRDRTILAHPESDCMISFRRQYSYNGAEKTLIKCIGVWDTVGALGIPFYVYQLSNKERYKFHDVVLSSWVENAFHALAIDEKRKLFAPALWETGDHFNKEGKNIMEQVWFSGVHANVGGGYQQNGLSDICLEWMMERVTGLGLHFHRRDLTDDSAEQKEVHIRPIMKGYRRDSIKDFWIYRLQTGCWRIMHYARQMDDQSKLRKDKAGHRIAATKTNESLHSSAYERLGAHIDKTVSPYLQDTAEIFRANHRIDVVALQKIDRTTVELRTAGDEVAKGKRKITLK